MRMIVIYLSMMSTAVAQSLATPPSPPSNTNYVYIDQIGDGNNIYILQQESDSKKAAVLIKGDANDISVDQRGTGNHIAYIGPGNPSAMAATNDGNTFEIDQRRHGNHSATINLNDPTANSNNNASITQLGGYGADKQFTLNLSGSNIGATVVQDNLTTPDSGSMSIQCYTGSCQGYSYIRH